LLVIAVLETAFFIITPTDTKHMLWCHHNHTILSNSLSMARWVKAILLVRVVVPSALNLIITR